MKKKDITKEYMQKDVDPAKIPQSGHATLNVFLSNKFYYSQNYFVFLNRLENLFIFKGISRIIKLQSKKYLSPQIKFNYPFCSMAITQMRAENKNTRCN